VTREQRWLRDEIARANRAAESSRVVRNRQHMAARSETLRRILVIVERAQDEHRAKLRQLLPTVAALKRPTRARVVRWKRQQAAKR
jgi:hypothetical protein